MNFMMMMLWQMLLAESVATHGTQGEVSTITTGAISAIAGGVVSVLVMYFRSRAKVTVDGEVNVKDSNRQRKPEVSWTEVRDLKDRMTHMERKMDEMKISQSDQFRTLLTGAFEREQRLAEKIENCVKPVHSRIDDIFKALAAFKTEKK